MMSSPSINELHSYTSDKWNTPNQLSNLHSCTTLNDPKMAPTAVEQEKNTENGDVVAEHHDEQYASTETSSSENNSDVQSFAKKVDKPRKTVCNLCHDFVGNSKLEYYNHLKTRHEATGRLLYCPLCPFIALYKHHLEYHFRKHNGLKPYKCDRCDYACVNQSMLNSHYKSHSDIYQYSCKNCSYMTKYLHSLKMHLRKYNHEPGRTLNPDGSISSNTIIDVHGKRRGPKSNKKRKSETDPLQENGKSPQSTSSPSPPSTSNQLPSPNIRILYNPHIYNNYAGNLYAKSEPSEALNYKVQSTPKIAEYSLKCSYCEFATSSYEIYHYHQFSHVYQNQTRANNFNPSFPLYVPQNADSRFATHYGTESFRKNNLNLLTTAERRKIGESSRGIDATNNDIYNPSSLSSAMNCEPQENNYMDKKESPVYKMVISPQLSPFNGHQYPKITSREHQDNGIKSSTPSPTFMVKDEIPKTMNEISNNFNDNAPLDLSLKQSSSPESRSNGYSPYSESPGTTMDRVSVISPKAEDESKVAIRGANRRKGKAFKLNQYIVENDPVSDGIENESFSLQRSEIQKSAPRINSKPNLNTAKWNGHSPLQSTQPEFRFMNGISNLKFDHDEPDNGVPTTKTAWDVPTDSWCKFCSINQGSAFLLQIHSSFHSEKDPFTCAKCGLRCHTRTPFLTHVMSGSRINGRCINAIEYES